MDKRMKILLIAVGIGLLVAIVSTSYAFFTIANKEGENTVITSGTMGLHLEDGPEITLNDAVPGTSITKTFYVENIGNVDTAYDIYLSEVINTFVDKTDLVYTLTSNDGGYSTTGQVEVPSTETKIVDTQAISVSGIHHYTLTITFLNKNENQDDNQGKEFSAKVQINEYKAAGSENSGSDPVNPHPTPDPSEHNEVIDEEDQELCNILTDNCDLDTIGSEIRIGSQPFYVMGKEDGKPKLLGKYNLNIANGIYGVYDENTYEFTAVNDGIQDKHARSIYENDWAHASISFFGDTSGNNPDYVLDDYVQFYFLEGEDSCKYDADFYYSNCRFMDEYKPNNYNPSAESSTDNIAYVFNYNRNNSGNYLNGLAKPLEDYTNYLSGYGITVSGRVVSHEELYDLGCRLETGDNNTSYRCDEAPTWVYGTSYWTGSAYESGEIFAVRSYVNESSYGSSNSTTPDYYGLRPVIILESY